VQSQQFAPVFWFWPVSIVINATTLLMDDVGTDPSAVASQGTTGVSIVGEQCKSVGVSQRRSPIWVSCLASENGGGSGSIATVLQEQDGAGNGPAIDSKGRVNFGKPIGAPNDLLTLQDSNFSKTVAVSGERPPNDAGDMAIGVDQAGGLAERAASSITSYINAVPNSGATNFLERLTAAGKTFNVPLTVNGNFSVPSGTVTLPVTGSGAQCLHVSVTGVLSGTGADCGSGSGGGSGTVNTGLTSQLAMYSANAAAVSGDSALTDNGSTLSYVGTGGISATGGAFSGNVTAGGISASAGTFSGNLTVGGQVIMTGPWLVNSPVPGTAMGVAATGTSSMGISNDGNFYISANAGTLSRVLTVASDAVPTVFGRAGAVMPMTGDYTCAQVTGCTANLNPTFTGTVTEPVPTLPSQAANTFFAAPSGGSGVPAFRALLAADVPTLNQSTTGNASTATTATNVAGGAIGSIPYQTGAGTTGMLAGNSTTMDQVVTSTGNGSTAVGPTLKNAPALSAANMTAFPNIVASVNPAGSLAAGDYVKATGFATTTDSGVLAGPYTIPWITAVRGGGSATFNQNVITMWGVVLTFPISTSQVTYKTTADNTANMYDIGIACGQTSCNGGAYTAGQIILDIGATAGTTFAPSASYFTRPWAQGAKSLQPGKYYIVLTTNCASSCAQVTAGGNSQDITFQNATTAGSTTGGSLGTSFTAPADIWSWGANIPAFIVK